MKLILLIPILFLLAGCFDEAQRAKPSVSQPMPAPVLPA